MFRRLPDIPFFSNLNRRPDYHALSKALDISKNARVKDESSSTAKLFFFKPDKLDEIKSFSMKKLGVIMRSSKKFSKYT